MTKAVFALLLAVFSVAAYAEADSSYVSLDQAKGLDQTVTLKAGQTLHIDRAQFKTIELTDSHDWKLDGSALVPNKHAKETVIFLMPVHADHPMRVIVRREVENP